MRPARIVTHLRRRAGAALIDNFFRGISAAGKMSPRARQELARLKIDRDIAYQGTGHPDHQLDVYRLRELANEPPGSLPVVMYVHGGGFRILSKDTHWIMGLVFARFGYLVFNVSYRLAPKHPYPAAVEDVAAAYEWVVQNATRYGGDVDRLILAGESAGGNLVTSLAVASTYERPEPAARRVWCTEVVPRAVVPACAIVQVSDADRFRRRNKKISTFINDRLVEVSSAYLRGVDQRAPGMLDLADPLVVLERGEKPTRPLPPFFIPCGTADPILDDTRRLARALDELGVSNEARYYPGEPHAFHALPMRKPAQECWRHKFEFLHRHGLAGVAMPDAAPRVRVASEARAHR